MKFILSLVIIICFVIIFLLSATEYHLGLLKAKLAKYRAQLLEPSGKSGAKVSSSSITLYLQLFSIVMQKISFVVGIILFVVHCSGVRKVDC